jgi:ApbE superfamily uncharacterized protein (UPF0280 family)
MTDVTRTAAKSYSRAATPIAIGPMALWAGAFTAIYIACGMAIAMVYTSR